MKISIYLKLFATLAKYMPEDADSYPVEEGNTVRDLVAKLAVPEKEARLIFINNRKADMSSLLHHGDRVGIFPPIGGG
ncbi:MAG: MoaD/ThiS family protein [Desulfococcaceae bacterium]